MCFRDSLKMEKEELVESLQILKRLHLVISEEERLKVNVSQVLCVSYDCNFSFDSVELT